VREPLLQVFPFPSSGKGDTAPALSGLRVYLQFMWEVGLSPSPLKFSSHCHFQKLSCSCLLGGAAAPAGCHVCLQFMWELGLLSSTLTSFPTPGCWAHAPLPPGLFIYSPGKDSLPPVFSAQGAPPSFQRVLTVLIAYYSVSLFFFLGGGQSVQGAKLLWPRFVCGRTEVPQNSPGPCLPKPYGHWPLAAPGALLVSPFNVKWRFSAPAGDEEGSKLCLFSVIMPAKCVSSVFPRFQYRRVAFCSYL
jgi:hypothetical protein